jgi:hypothetical protein
MTRRRLPVLVAAAGALLASSTPPARAEFPALTRELAIESYARDPGSLEVLRGTHGLAGSVALLYLARADQPGGASPRATRGHLGGHGTLKALVSRWTLAADALLDRRGVEVAEHETRLWVAAAVPEARASLRGLVGFANDEHAGADLELELAPLPVPLPVPDLDLRPELVVWLRGRAFDSGRTSLNPAAGLVMQHLPGLGSALALAVSAQTDLAQGEAPRSFGMLQVRWSPEMAPALPEGDLPVRPGVRRPSPPDPAWFAFGAYAFPIDRRHLARLALGLGLRFRQLF